MLGFLMRICYEFKNPLALTSLYYAHVRSHMEYAAVVWSPNYAIHSKRIESIQKKFFAYIFKKFGWHRYIQYAPYTFKCSLLGIASLEHRRRDACAIFVFNILTGKINSPALLPLVQLNAPNFLLRQCVLLRVDRHRTNYGANAPMSNMIRIFNSVSDLFDFNLSRRVYRNRLACNFEL